MADTFAQGTTFSTMKDARLALQNHTAIEGLPHKVKKAEASRYIAVCRTGEQCTFYVRVHWRAKEQDAIVSIYRPHSCRPKPEPEPRTPTPPPPPPVIPPPDPFPFEVGNEYPTLKDAQQALLLHIANQKLSYRVKKCEASRYIAVCRGDKNCTFYVRISWRNKHQDAIVSTYNPHTCNQETHENWPATSSVKYLAGKHRAAYRVNPDMKPADIRRLELEEGNHVTFKQAWRTLKIVRQDLGIEEPPTRKYRPRDPNLKKGKKAAENPPTGEDIEMGTGEGEPKEEDNSRDDPDDPARQLVEMIQQVVE